MFISTTPGYNWNLSSLSDGYHSILRRCHSARTPPPTVDSRWTSRFLQRHPEFHIRNKRHLDDSASNRIIQTISSPGLISTKGILYVDGARAMVRKKQEDDAAAKIRHAQIELERAQKIARQDRNKKWKSVFQQLKWKVRERNARLKEHKKRWKAIFQELKRRFKLRNARLKFVAENPQNM
jgi:hypothetical protein